MDSELTLMVTTDLAETPWRDAEQQITGSATVERVGVVPATQSDPAMVLMLLRLADGSVVLGVTTWPLAEAATRQLGRAYRRRKWWHRPPYLMSKSISVSERYL